MKNKKPSDTKIKRETSEKLAQPASPVAIGAQIKLIAETQSKTTGKKSWVLDHLIDVTIFLGFVWSIGKIMDYFYPQSLWFAWVKIVDAFIPAVIIILSIIYRVQPYFKKSSARKNKA